MRLNRTICLFLEILIFATPGVNTGTVGAESIIEAAREGDLEQVRNLIVTASDINAKDDHGRTALHYAAMVGHEDIVALLIARGADINLKNDYDITPLAEAIDGAYPMGAGTAHDRIIKLLVANGADVTVRGESGMTALHWAVNTGQRDFAEQLIDKGAEIDAKEDSDRTSLHDAARDGNIDIVRPLIEKGADVNITQGMTGSTPLHSAAFAGHKDVVMLLVANGADITKRDDSGSAPLHDAAWEGHTDIIEFLLAKGADVHWRDVRGRTPLHLAAEYGKKDAVELLIGKGADLNAENEYGATPLGLAIEGYRRDRQLPEANDVDGYCKRGDHFRWEGKFDRAIEDYTSALELDPANDRAYLLRGWAWAEGGNAQKAIKDWKKAIELQWSNALDIYYAQNLFESRDAVLDQLIREVASDHLEDLHMVSGYAIGYGGGPGGFYTASLILAKPFQEDVFLKMTKSVNPVIRAMGLICLARQDISRHEATLRSLYTDNAEVSYCPVGCGVGTLSIGDIAKHIIEDPNLLDCWSPSHTESMPSPPIPHNRQGEFVQERLDAARSLLERGAEVNPKDKQGQTPLHYAAQYGRTRFARLLMSNGAEIDARNHRGETPLCVAVRWGYQDVAELLLENGADVNAKDSGGKTPLDIAIEKDYRTLTKFLREKTQN